MVCLCKFSHWDFCLFLKAELFQFLQLERFCCRTTIFKSCYRFSVKLRSELRRFYDIKIFHLKQLHHYPNSGWKLSYLKGDDVCILVSLEKSLTREINLMQLNIYLMLTFYFTKIATKWDSHHSALMWKWYWSVTFVQNNIFTCYKQFGYKIKSKMFLEIVDFFMQQIWRTRMVTTFVYTVYTV